MESFINIKMGPLIGIDSIHFKQKTLHDICSRGFFVISCITNPENETFQLFLKGQQENNNNLKTAMVFVTAYYLKNYE